MRDILATVLRHDGHAFTSGDLTPSMLYATTSRLISERLQALFTAGQHHDGFDDTDAPFVRLAGHR